MFLQQANYWAIIVLFLSTILMAIVKYSGLDRILFTEARESDSEESSAIPIENSEAKKKTSKKDGRMLSN